MAIGEPWTTGAGRRDLDVISNGLPETWSGESPARPARRLGPRARASVAAVGVLVLLSAAIWVANRQVGRSEFSAVLECVRASEQTLTDIDAQLAATAKYVAPQVGPQSSLLIRDDLYRLIEDAADGAEPNLDVDLTGCDDVAIAPLYHRLATARRAYVGYLDAQLAHLHDISRDGTAQFRPAPELAPLLASARAALAGAAPDSTDRRRVDALLPTG